METGVLCGRNNILIPECVLGLLEEEGCVWGQVLQEEGCVWGQVLQQTKGKRKPENWRQVNRKWRRVFWTIVGMLALKPRLASNSSSSSASPPKAEDHRYPHAQEDFDFYLPAKSMGSVNPPSEVWYVLSEQAPPLCTPSSLESECDL